MIMSILGRAFCTIQGNNPVREKNKLVLEDLSLVRNLFHLFYLMLESMLSLITVKYK